MAAAGGIALVHVASAAEASMRFAGRTLVERAVALAVAAGLHPVLVAPGGVLGELARETAAPGRRPGDPLPDSPDPGRPVVAWRCDAVFVAGLLRDLLADGAPRTAALRDDAGRVAIVRCDLGQLGGLVPADPFALPSRVDATAAEATRHRVLAVGAAAPGGRSESAAAAELVATLENPRDGLFDRLLNRPISRRLTPRLLALPVTPNQVTLLSFAVGLVAAAAFAGAGPWWPVAGALLVQATAVLDCVDGEIARAKVLESAQGEMLDVASDSAIQILAFLGIAVHVWPELGARQAWLLGSLFAAGGLAAFAVVTRAERTEERWKRAGSPSSRWLSAMLATLTTRDLSVLLLVAAILGLLRPLLVGAAFGAHAFWMLALALHARAMREAAGGEPPAADDQARSVTR